MRKNTWTILKCISGAINTQKDRTGLYMWERCRKIRRTIDVITSPNKALCYCYLLLINMMWSTNITSQLYSYDSVRTVQILHWRQPWRRCLTKMALKERCTICHAELIWKRLPGSTADWPDIIYLSSLPGLFAGGLPACREKKPGTPYTFNRLGIWTICRRCLWLVSTIFSRQSIRLPLLERILSKRDHLEKET